MWRQNCCISFCLILQRSGSGILIRSILKTYHFSRIMPPRAANIYYHNVWMFSDAFIHFFIGHLTENTGLEIRGWSAKMWSLPIRGVFCGGCWALPQNLVYTQAFTWCCRVRVAGDNKWDWSACFPLTLKFLDYQSRAVQSSEIEGVWC